MEHVVHVEEGLVSVGRGLLETRSGHEGSHLQIAFMGTRTHLVPICPSKDLKAVRGKL